MNFRTVVAFLALHHETSPDESIAKRRLYEMNSLSHLRNVKKLAQAQAAICRMQNLVARMLFDR